ncbi:MAG: response regulator [Holosporales bacterium]|jgi:transcriptional regulator with XRE-family HTH domain|nr:response regulator [Holosporales bacterium]
MDINAHIGRKLQEQRKKARLTLEQVSGALHVTYQQVQKYEAGRNKIPIDKLYDYACLFQLPVQYFFDGAPELFSKESKIDGIFFPPKNDHHLNLLLAESDPIDEFLIRKTLGELDNEIKIFCVHDDTQITNFLKRKNTVFPKPDLIFLDLVISRRRGHSIISEIKRDPTIQDIPIIVIANSICLEDLNRAYKSGVASFICKSASSDKMKKDLSVCIQYWGHVVVLPSAAWKKT